VVSDQHVLTTLMGEEGLAEDDHTLAVAFGGDEARLDLNEEPAERRKRDVPQPGNVEVDSVCEVLGSLAKMSVKQGDNGMNGENVATSASSASSSARSGPCVSCMKNVKEEALIRSSCDHLYCRDCVRDLFLAATKDEELYPPRCCGNVFSPEFAMQLLSYKELAVFSAKGVEFTSETKTDCGDPTCSTFLLPWLIDEERATCPKCWKTTHVPCQTVVEDGPDHECPPDEATQ